MATPPIRLKTAQSRFIDMRILIVGINFYPELTGIGKYSGDMAAYLVDHGHDVHVVTAPPYYPAWQVQPGYKAWQYRQETWMGVGVQRCPIWAPRKLSGWKRILHLGSFAISSLPVLIGQAFWRPDVVLCIAPSLMDAPFALLVARLSGAKAWLHLQDFEVEAAIHLGMLPSQGVFTWLAARIERQLIIRFDRVSTISNRMLAHLRQKGVRQGRCVLFPNWVDPRVIFPLREERERLRHEFGFPAENTILLYSGNMGNKQGLEVLIEAAKLVRSRPEILFVLCGDGAQRQYLEQRARGLENVQFLAVQPLDRLNALLNTADIHLLPQRAGAEDLVLPSKLAGMLASGVPVILMANQGTELDEIGQQVGVVVPPEDAAALVGAIFELQEDAPRRRRLGQAGLNWAKMYWFKEQVLSEFVRQLEALMVGSHPGE